MEKEYQRRKHCILCHPNKTLWGCDFWKETLWISHVNVCRNSLPSKWQLQAELIYIKWGEDSKKPLPPLIPQQPPENFMPPENDQKNHNPDHRDGKCGLLTSSLLHLLTAVPVSSSHWKTRKTQEDSKTDPSVPHNFSVSQCLYFQNRMSCFFPLPKKLERREGTNDCVFFAWLTYEPNTLVNQWSPNPLI